MTQKAPMNKPVTADETRAQHEINGARRANANLIAYALEQIKPGDERTNVEKVAALTLEREQAVAALRRLASQCGADGEWKEGPLVEMIDGIAKAIGESKAPEKSKR